MKTFLRILTPLLLAVAALSCTKAGDHRDVVRYEPDWAAVYEYPLDGTEHRGVGLMLVQGRTDEDLNLSSTGVVASLVLCVPIGGTEFLPSGTYDLAPEDDSPMLMFGTRDESGGVVGSFVAERLPERSVIKFYALRQGRVTVAVEGGEYHILAELEADGRFFEFDYRGEVQDLGTDAF